jgi:beta-galactosidase
MAHSTITHDGLLINGEPIYLLSGVIHYFRWPKGEWRDILLKAKAGGLNTIDTVIPWNLHEPEPGVFNFAAEADLPAYLDLIHELGMYAIVRPGPYICAEWENGGFPVWLTARSATQNLKLRTDDPVFLAAVQRWFDRLLPIFVARQIDRGGPIILCQIENEHWASGVYGHDAHQATLAQMQHNAGLTVPFYTCMGGLDGYPEFRNGWSGMAAKLQATRSVWPDNPMIVSELWSGWFDSWGASAHNGKSAASLDRMLHELIAVGCSGVSHWVFAGGTNFGWYGGRTVGGDTIHMTTSYDYDAPITELGNLTEKFFVARRHHLFLNTLGAQVSRLLADAQPGGPTVIVPPAVKGRWAGGEEPFRTVKNGDFSATFLQNTIADRTTLQVFNTDPNVHLAIDVDAHSLKPIYFNLALSPSPENRGRAGVGVRVNYHTSRLLGYWPNYLVLYGFHGEVGDLQLQADEPWEVGDAGNARVTVTDNTLTLHYWTTDRPQVIQANHLNIVILTQAYAERWWPRPDGSFLCGPDLVLEDGTVSEAGIFPYWEMRNSEFRIQKPELRTTQYAVSLEWETLAVTELVDNWLNPHSAIHIPQSFDELGCYLDYGWYAMRFDLAEPLDTTLTVPWISDRGHVFIDGQRLGTVGISPEGPIWTLPMKLSAGRHELRMLVDNLGRFNYGSNTGEQKGLLDNIYRGGQQENISTGWMALWQEAAFAGEAIANVKPQHVRADAINVDLGNFAFQGAHVWLLREIEMAAGESIIVQFTGDRNPGALYVNGQAVQRFSRHHGGGYIKRDITSLLQPGKNILALHIEGYAGAPWQAQLLRFDQSQVLQGEWYFKKGTTPTPALARSLPRFSGEGVPTPLLLSWAASTQERGPGGEVPRFYRAYFGYDVEKHGREPFRFDAHGLRKGHLWLNGQALGRYWQIGPQEFYKVPAAWMKAENELLILEEEDGQPQSNELCPA